ncbi:hypothetical protein BDA99DRAFT_173792 [Phascolomyces articulosus]|uniref:Uncharacterized protein n=1 Tax=Phascolomyces articulosus TaxID=60185 RepID=A0AAD5K3J7_9FUNG|nr:hypothetical protein BDA99DRAFT_173792 [Phascolomyces articulosus]
MMNRVIDISSFHRAIKDTSSDVRCNFDSQRKWQKKVIKITEQFRDMYGNDGSLLISKAQGDLNYIAKYISPLLQKLFKHTNSIVFDWGDSGLSASKDEEHRAQKDNEVRSRGVTPDGIFRLVEFSTDFALVEISGPPTIHNHHHYVGDRNKLGKSLKQILKSIQQMVNDGDQDLYHEIKLYGIQIYLNTLHLYSLSEPERGVYVYQEVMSIKIACPVGLLPTSLAKIVRKFWKLKDLILDSANKIELYLKSDTGAISSDDSDDSRDTVYISPTKKYKKQSQNAATS